MDPAGVYNKITSYIQTEAGAMKGCISHVPIILSYISSECMAPVIFIVTALLE